MNTQNIDAFIIEDKFYKTWKRLIPYFKVDYCYFSETDGKFRVTVGKDNFYIQEYQFNKYLDWLKSKDK